MLQHAQQAGAVSADTPGRPSMWIARVDVEGGQQSKQCAFRNYIHIPQTTSLDVLPRKRFPHRPGIHSPSSRPTAPAPPLPLPLHLHQHIQAALAEIRDRPLPCLVDLRAPPDHNMHDSLHATVLALAHPEPRHLHARHALQAADAGEGFAEVELRVLGDGEQQALGGRGDEGDGGGEDQDGDEAGGEGVEARPAGVVDQDGGEHDGDGAEGVGQDVEEDAVHVFVAVVVVGVLGWWFGGGWWDGDGGRRGWDGALWGSGGHCAAVTAVRLVGEAVLVNVDVVWFAMVMLFVRHVWCPMGMAPALVV